MRTVSTPRERLLAAANELFYREGVHAVGIDRVIAEASVAKTSLYSSFGNKDGLIAAYLESRDQQMREGVEQAIGRHQSARDQLLALFDFLIELSSDPNYHGCAFAMATSEAHAESTDVVAKGYRSWLRGTFTQLASQAGAPNPRTLGHQLHLLWDGAAQSARMDGGQQGAWAARAAAVSLLDAALHNGGR